MPSRPCTAGTLARHVAGGSRIPAIAQRFCERSPLILVRLLLFIALATIAGALALYMIKRDRRYLRFVAQVVKFTILLLAGVLVFYAFERLVAMA
jgi:hypothetical protein